MGGMQWRRRSGWGIIVDTQYYGLYLLIKDCGDAPLTNKFRPSSSCERVSVWVFVDYIREKTYICMPTSARGVQSAWEEDNVNISNKSNFTI